jgi:antitoxin ParD1/3/4
MKTFTITLRDEDRLFIEAAMKEGRYATESEAVSDAFAELRARDQSRHVRLDALRKQVMAGIEQLDRGEGIRWNPEEVERKGRALLKSRNKSA